MPNVDVKPAGNRTTLANKMSIGQIASVLCGPYEGLTIMRTYDGFVALNRPGTTWNRDCTLSVEVLPVGSIVTLTVTE